MLPAKFQKYLIIVKGFFTVFIEVISPLRQVSDIIAHNGLQIGEGADF